MAFTKSTVGNAASGADYAADVGALQLWETAKDSVGGEQEAEIITGITDDCTFGDWAASSDVWVHGDTQGVTRQVLTQNTGYAIYFNDANINTILVEDIDIDGNGAANQAVYARLATSCDIKRVSAYSNGGTKPLFRLSMACTLENVLAYDATQHGFSVQDGSAVTFKNCCAYKNASMGFYWTETTNTVNLYNCLSIGNTGDDYRSGGAGTGETTLLLDSCVSGDATADDTENLRTNTDVEINASSTGTYFTDYTNNDFHLAQAAATSFSPTPNTGQTPATDLDSVTRSADDLGCYEFVSAGANVPQKSDYYNRRRSG